MVVRSPAEERQIRTRLTTLKLALQLLDRRGALPEDRRVLVRTALEATDALAATVEGLSTAGTAVPAGGERLRAQRASRGRSPLGLIWRLAWPLGRRMVLGLARPMLAASVVGLRARGSRREAGPRERSDREWAASVRLSEGRPAAQARSAPWR